MSAVLMPLWAFCKRRTTVLRISAFVPVRGAGFAPQRSCFESRTSVCIERPPQAECWEIYGHQWPDKLRFGAAEGFGHG